jgi:SAM-dependent methyltransferase
VRSLRARWSAYIDQQHRLPSGLVGRVIGGRMLRQHAPETNWSIELLQLQPGDRVLELGFGAGRGLGLALARLHGGHVTGIDRSPTMLRVARRRYRAAIIANRLALLQGDLTQLPFSMGQFTKIVSIHTFYFWPEPLFVCEQLMELLAPTGRLVSTFATGQRLPTGEWTFWKIHHQAEALVEALKQRPELKATLAYGPDSRQFNNVAIVIEKV